MKYVVYDWRSNKGFWRPMNKGYTNDLSLAGQYEPHQLPTWAGDCWIAIPIDSALEIQKILDNDYATHRS